MKATLKLSMKALYLKMGIKLFPQTLKFFFSSSDVSKVYVYIREGKYHQIKGCLNQSVKGHIPQRLAMGSLTLDENLKPGEWRELSEEELSFLKSRYKSKAFTKALLYKSPSTVITCPVIKFALSDSKNSTAFATS